MYDTKGKEYVVEYYYWCGKPKRLRFEYIIVSAESMVEAAKKTYDKYQDVDIRTIVRMRQ